ncbi:YueH family protein [Robertmurraya massiliosenegalensis]|uniref:YueH family protein n=1 Tax=Robertmurraya massiliosenegalensis TaxID=1287657 RepID=UPI0002D4E50F|nr:YueH family protein [Robertmurraya massiliosenegalensis]
MKIRKDFSNGQEQKVFIYENKKEEYILVAIPDINWSASFAYDEDLIEDKLDKTLLKVVDKESASRISKKIYQWTREM